MKARDLFDLFKQAFSEWRRDNVPLLASSISFFVLVSLSPLLIIFIAIIGYLVGQGAVENAIIMQFQSVAGPNFAKIIQDVLHQASNPASTYKATVVGIILLLLGAAGLFVQTEQALNIIWGIKPLNGWMIRNAIKSYILSFILTMIIGFLILAKVLITIILLPVSEYFQYILPFDISILYIMNFFGSIIFFTALFAIIYKILSDVEVRLIEVLPGSAVTALFFLIGNIFMEIYVTVVDLSSVYGVTSSLFVFFIWIFYSVQIFLFGAELIKVLKGRHKI